jgi:hypothetical protein
VVFDCSVTHIISNLILRRGAPRLYLNKIEVKFALEEAMKAQRGSRGVYSFFNLDSRWDGWSMPRLGRFTPGNETRYKFYRRLGGPNRRC